MAAFPHDCPHCETKRANFQVRDEYRPAALPGTIQAFVSCGVCGTGAVAVFLSSGGHVDTLKGSFPVNPDLFTLLDFHPKPSVPQAPLHLPDQVRDYYLEAAEHVTRAPTSAGLMLRKTLEVGLNHIAPSSKETLQQRIDALATSGAITKDLAEWAHRIRLDGNDAAHKDNPFTKEQAEQLHHLTQLVLMYLFSLPGMLKEWSK